MVTSLKRLANLILKIVDSDRDCFCVVTGETGGGKSVLSIILSEQVSRLTGQPFNYKKNIVYNTEDLIKLIDGKDQLPERSVILIDEMINLMYKRNWHAAEQKKLLTLFDMCRDRHLIIIGCIPRFTNLDKHLLSSKVKLWFHLPRRGRAWTFMPDECPFIDDVWNIKNNIKTWYHFRGKMEHNLRRFKGFLDTLDFPDLTEQQKEVYLEVRKEKRKIELDKAPKETEGTGLKAKRFVKHRDTLIKLCAEMGASHQEIADQLDLSTRVIRGVIRGN
jgi:hypothetical protein